MKIERKENDLVITVPLYQKSFDAIDQDLGLVPNLVGVIAGDEFTISYSIDMGYCGKCQQEGMPVVYFVTREELEEACKIAGLDIWEHTVCSKCKKVLRGTHTWGDSGAECLEHQQ